MVSIFVPYMLLFAMSTSFAMDGSSSTKPHGNTMKHRVEGHTGLVDLHDDRSTPLMIADATKLTTPMNPEYDENMMMADYEYHDENIRQSLLDIETSLSSRPLSSISEHTSEKVRSQQYKDPIGKRNTKNLGFKMTTHHANTDKTYYKRSFSTMDLSSTSLPIKKSTQNSLQWSDSTNPLRSFPTEKYPVSSSTLKYSNPTQNMLKTDQTASTFTKNVQKIQETSSTMSLDQISTSFKPTLSGDGESMHTQTEKSWDDLINHPMSSHQPIQMSSKIQDESVQLQSFTQANPIFTSSNEMTTEMSSIDSTIDQSTTSSKNLRYTISTNHGESTNSPTNPESIETKPTTFEANTNQTYSTLVSSLSPDIFSQKTTEKKDPAFTTEPSFNHSDSISTQQLVNINISASNEPTIPSATTNRPENTIISSQSSSFPKTTSGNKVDQCVKPSPERVEISESDKVDIVWICPPTNEIMNPAQYQWYQIPHYRQYSPFALQSQTDSMTKKSILRIKGDGYRHEGRYVCATNKSNLFHSRSMYFYQIVVLPSKWINVGTMSTVELYRNQQAIINCPYGDIIKNNITFGSSCSAGRIKIKETSINSTTDVYRCSDSSNQTIKLPATESSQNCSLSLLGCGNTSIAVDTKALRSVRMLDKCNFNQSMIGQSPGLRCPGKVFVRFYFDRTSGQCFPFETNLCQEDSYSFDSLRQCEQTCVTISPELTPCFHAANVDRTLSCSSLEVKGTYLVSYELETNECKWFYHCGESPLSANVFKTISKCQQMCISKEKQIRYESFKACNYLMDKTESTLVLNYRRWVFNRTSQQCEMLALDKVNGSNYFRFTTKRRCQSFCRSLDEEICQSRPENGECFNQKIKWHFHMDSARCITILDRGCGKSLNRFDSKSDCEETCHRFLSPITTRSPTTMGNISTNIRTESTSQHTSAMYHMTSKPFLKKRFHRRINAPIESTRPPPITEKPVPQLFIPPMDLEIEFDPCFKNAKKGSCDYGFGRTEYQMIRYSFDSGSARCVKIKYSGCKGGENLFDDANDCKSSCESRLQRSMKLPGCRNPFSEKCVAPDDTKNQTSLQRYFFIPMTDECVSFTSVNNRRCKDQYFETNHKCLQTCQRKPPMEQMLQNRCFGKIVLSNLSCSMEQKSSLWFYMAAIDQCLQYSTCPVDIDGNVFLTKSDCDNACRASNINTICDLPADSGRGHRRIRRFYHDSSLGKCSFFDYKGSLGNSNRFKTKKECENACTELPSNGAFIKHSPLVSSSKNQTYYNGTSTGEIWLHERIEREYCFDPHRYGGCRADNPQIFIKKYYYDAYHKQCEPYMFSGCGSTSRNSFESVQVCDKMCTERIVKTTSSLCSQKVYRCTESPWIYWSYNPDRGVCEPFPSCNKKSDDQFFFETEQSCSNLCTPMVPLKKDLFDICHLPEEIDRNCSTHSDRWYYDDAARSCQLSVGCARYGNNFPSHASCMSACDPSQLRDVCQLPADKGPCTDNRTTKYYFHWPSQTCRPFLYGGCLGNRNRFHTAHECQQMCSSASSSCQTVYLNPARCKNRPKHLTTSYFFYDPGSAQCQPVNESICVRHSNLFPTMDQCNNTCSVPADLMTIIHHPKPKLDRLIDPRCLHSLKFNEYPICSKHENWLPRYFYDKDQDQCVFFYYNGCDGIEDRDNRFTILSQCHITCLDKKSTTEPTATITPLTKATSKPLRQKPGFCPQAMTPCLNQGNLTKCDSDLSCDFWWKCCPCETGGTLLSMCMEPLGCLATPFGCCADGVSKATDHNHSECTLQPAQIISDQTYYIKGEDDDDVMLNCAVIGDPKPNISWIFHGEQAKVYPVESKLDLINPVWSGSYRIDGSENLEGMWSCQVTNEGGWDEKEIYVTSSKNLTSILKVSTPENTFLPFVDANLNGKAALHCPIYGISKPTIRWFHSSIDVNASWPGNISIFNKLLYIDPVTLDHGGNWICNGSNELGNISMSLTLNIIEINEIPPNITVKANRGQKIVLFCETNVTSVQWFRKLAQRLIQVNSSLEEDVRVLAISNFQPVLNSGIFICESISGDIKRTLITFHIVPYSDDDIIVNPSGTLFPGMIVTLTCPVKLMDRDRFTSIQWTKDGVIIVDETRIDVDFVVTSSLDSGRYSCQRGLERYESDLAVVDKSFYF